MWLSLRMSRRWEALSISIVLFTRNSFRGENTVPKAMLTMRPIAIGFEMSSRSAAPIA